MDKTACRWGRERGLSAAPLACRPEVQALLSKIRTDLDSFTEVEAYSLMLDGYLVSNHALSRSEAFKRLARAPREPDSEDWEFMKIRPWVEKPTPQYLNHLPAAGSQFFTIFKLNTPMAIGVMALLAVFVWWLVFKSPLADARIGIDVQCALITALIAGTAFLLPRLTENFSSLRFLTGLTRKLASYLGQGVLPLLATLPARLHLKFIDPLFIRMGRLKNLAPPR
jgi:NTE family protein